MSAQALAVFGEGADPPPLNTDPSRLVATSEVEAARRSACVICPSFSSSDIRDSRSVTRAATGCVGSWYGSAADRAVGAGATPTPPAPTASETSMQRRQATRRVRVLNGT